MDPRPFWPWIRLLREDERRDICRGLGITCSMSDTGLWWYVSGSRPEDPDNQGNTTRLCSFTNLHDRSFIYSFSLYRSFSIFLKSGLKSASSPRSPPPSPSSLPISSCTSPAPPIQATLRPKIWSTTLLSTHMTTPCFIRVTNAEHAGSSSPRGQSIVASARDVSQKQITIVYLSIPVLAMAISTISCCSFFRLPC